MFGPDWQLSPRVYEVERRDDVRFVMSDGVELSADVFVPVDAGPCPVILGAHPYTNEFQTTPIMPTTFSLQRGYLESGDPEFYVRRGYVHVILNVRGSGRSGGRYPFMGPREVDDLCEVIEQLASAPYSDGNVGMFGVSYFAWIQKLVAARNPEALRCIFAPWGATDFYRDGFYHGGVLSYRFIEQLRFKLDNPRHESWSAQAWGEDEAAGRAATAAREDDELRALPKAIEILEDPFTGTNSIVTDVLLNPLDDQFWQERLADGAASRIPAYLGGCWGNYGLHLMGGFRSWANWGGVKKLTMGPPYYLDRPVYQLQYESLRWFDHWLKGNDTGMMDEPAVQVFMPGADEWRSADDFPLPETKWTPFLLHQGGLLTEHEYFPAGGLTTFFDSPYARGAAEFATPPMAERVEFVGPCFLNLSFSTTDTDATLFVALFVERDGERHEITRGWLRASQRRIDPEASLPWLPHFPHDQRDELTPGEVVHLTIPLEPTARCLLPDERLVVRIKGADDDEEPSHSMERIFRGHASRQGGHAHTIHHSAEHPSSFVVPITSGNTIGTFIGGRSRSNVIGPVPYPKFDKAKHDD